jgi:CRP/FNR family nitrogen fixation transcriptional regulator
MRAQSTAGIDGSNSSETKRMPCINRNQLGGLIRFPGIPVKYPRNAEIYGDSEPANYLYKVVSGAVRTSKVRTDGRHQVSGFYLPGEIFGIEVGDEHAFSAEALTDCQVVLINRRLLMERAAREPALLQELWRLVGHELKRAERHIVLLIKNAEEKIASFLLEMAERAFADNIINLPMTRRDIGDYLGITVETVSRTLIHLQASGTIGIQSRQIVLRDVSVLRRLNA